VGRALDTPSRLHPAPTIAFGHDAASAKWFSQGHPQARIAVSEAGVLQSFPADYPWSGTKTKQYLQAGNAVPPLMALHALSAASGIAIPATVAEENVA
jgi:DNA (cytosine-5)-methyltransferase 1